MKNRVIPTAKKQGADYYKPKKTKGDSLKKNERWIDDQMRKGREIIDIGPDPRRSKRSLPYVSATKSVAKEPNRIYSARELKRRAENPRNNNAVNPNHNFPESFNAEIFKGNKTIVSDKYLCSANIPRPHNFTGLRM